ncbi:MAG: translation initiation factor IF-6 [DPANN group archaeon]|nr:translation initiation factor IF-6 [DPANN group archaeon]
MKVLKIDFDGNPNIGLYAFATDEYCLIGQDVSARDRRQIEKVLKVPTYPMTIGGTSLIGVFVNGNSRNLLLPSITFDYEKKALEKLSIPFRIIESSHTAFGNNTLIGEQVCLVSDEYSAFEKKRIREALDLKTVPGTIGQTGTVGSQAAITGKGIFVSDQIGKEEEAELVKHFGLPLAKGTINQQNPYIHSGIIANSNGCAIGSHSSGVEINDALQALGFL